MQDCCAPCISQMRSNQLQYGKVPLLHTAAHCQLLQQHQGLALTCAANTSQYCLPPSFHWLFSSCRDTKPAQMTINCSSSPQGMRCRACSRPVAAPCSVSRDRLNLQGSGPQVPGKRCWASGVQKRVWQVFTGLTPSLTPMQEGSGGSTSSAGMNLQSGAGVTLSNAVTR